MSHLRVSLVCPSFNASTYVENMIGSVLAQDYPFVELFVQDGGSTDGTIDILRRHPVRWASAPDNGISQALNRAIQATDGDIIGITCTDDLVAPGAISAAVDVFERKSGVVMVYGDCAQIDLDGRPFKFWESMPFNLDWLFWDCFIPAQTVYLRRDVIDTIGGFDESLALVQDFDLWLRIGAHYGSDRVEYIPRVQGSYRVVVNSAGLGRPLESVACILKVMSKFLDDPAWARHLRRGKQAAQSGILLQLVASYLMAHEKALAWKTFTQAVRMYPRALLTSKGVLTVPQLLAGDGLRRLYRRIEQVANPRRLVRYR